MSPRVRRSDKKTQLMELINHLRMYRKVTLQLVYMIASWQQEVLECGYRDGIVQFLYRQEDYLMKINTDTADILNDYQSLFQNNPFLLMKKAHEKT